MFIQKISWLIPTIPMLGSIFMTVLLISFNRTINRLTKPISIFLIGCVSISTVTSSILFFRDISDKSLDLNFRLATLNLHFTLYLNLFVEKILSIGGLLIMLAMIFSFYFLERKKGYVRYMTSISTLSAIFFFFVLNGFIPDLLH